MANQRLTDFQIQLMERLKTGESTETLANWLAIEVAGFKYLIPLAEAGSIISLTDTYHIEKVAHTKEWFLGVSNFRGFSYAVIDLAAWFGVREHHPNLLELAKNGAAFVTFHESLGMSCALLVDKIAGLRSDSDWKSSHCKKNNLGEEGECFADMNGQVWHVMRLTDLARDEFFLSIEC